MKCTNCNAKNVRKVFVNKYDKKHTLMMSFDDKCIVKIGSPRVSLALCPKNKACWVAESVDISTADHDTTVKPNFLPTVIFNIDIPNNPNLGSF